MKSKSRVVKRSVVISGHKTSVSLEEAFLKGLKEIASHKHLTLSEMVSSIDAVRNHGNLSSAIRLYVLDYYRTLIGDAARSITPRLSAQKPSSTAA
jgi:predicted DNA-binding ribbon-helix-helix protein